MYRPWRVDAEDGRTLDRALDDAGPRLNAVLAVSPRALKEATQRDRERKSGQIRGPLHGVPVLLKDNIEADDGLPTTAGSLALKDNVTGRDAPLVARMRDGGAVILGKTNLSEWANFRSPNSISGWSAIGGLTRNPHALDRNACGSSSGSAVAVAAGFAPVAVGTETDGSITCPAAMNGIVGLKPTVGLVSRGRIVPISETQDTAGPMARNIADAAALLAAMAGSDPADPATREADARRADYLAALDARSLRGVRLGVWQPNRGKSAGLDAVFDQAVASLRAAGAELIDLPNLEFKGLGDAENLILGYEFKAGINAYLATTPPTVRARTLDELIAFNAAEPRETVLFGQELFHMVAALGGLDEPTYLKAKADARRIAGAEGIDRWVGDHRLDAIVAPTNAPAPLTDPVNGSEWFGSASSAAAVAGYPHLTVPMGAVRGLPVGLSFIGPAWSDAKILSLGYAFEQATRARLVPTFRPGVEADDDLEAAYAPLP